MLVMSKVFGKGKNRETQTMIDFLTELIIDFWNWLHKTDLYYTPYKTNIIGEHRYNEKTDKRNKSR